MAEISHVVYAKFLTTTLVVFVVLTSILVGIDFFPEVHVKEAPAFASSTSTQEAPTSLSFATSTVKNTRDENESAIPVRVVVSEVGIDSAITSPKSSEGAILNRALLAGVVRYPASGDAGQKGNMLLFGHSSYLPVVKNKAFQVFNELGKVEEGDMLTVYSTTHEYHYRVRSVRLTKASEAVIPFLTDESLLTLATCNTFGQKEDRFVVEAVFVDKEPLSS